MVSLLFRALVVFGVVLACLLGCPQAWSQGAQYGPGNYLQNTVTYGGQVVQIQPTDDVVFGNNPQGKAQSLILPAPVNGKQITIKDQSGNAANANLTITPFNGVGLIDGAASYTISNNYGSVVLTYQSGGGWFSTGSSGSAGLSPIATNTVLGNITASSAVPVGITQTQLTTLVNNFTSALSGGVPSSGGGTTNFLRADATWTVPVGFANPMTTQGDIIFENATPAAARLGAGTSGALLQTKGNAANPVWTTATYPATVSAGDLLYGSASNVISSLGIGTQYQLLQTNTGAAAPQWVTLVGGTGITYTASTQTIALTTPVTVANGGSNATSLAGNGVVIMNSGGTAMTVVAPGSNGNVLTSNGTVWQSSASGAGTVTSFSSGNLSPLFTTSVATATTTPALSFSLSNANAGTALMGPINNAGGAAASAAAPTYRAPDVTDMVNFKNDGRLTLTSGTPVTSSDVTAATLVYYSPYGGNHITLYNNTQSKWVTQTFSEVSVAPPANTNTPFDIFITTASNSTITATAVAWTNDTTRATNITLLNGRYVKSGGGANQESLYVGTCRTTGSSGQTEDSASRRFVFNNYNRVIRHLVATQSGTWTYTTATIRAANANTTDGQGRVSLVVGVSEDAVHAEVLGEFDSTTNPNATVGIGVDSTSAFSGLTINAQADNSIITNVSGAIPGVYTGILAVGGHFLQWCEESQASGTTTWQGSATPSGAVVQCGLQANMRM